MVGESVALARETASYVPPPELVPKQLVPKLVDEWLGWWHEQHRVLRGKNREEVIVGLAELHHRFLVIHPFMDANGRIATSVTDQAAESYLTKVSAKNSLRTLQAIIRRWLRRTRVI